MHAKRRDFEATPTSRSSKSRREIHLRGVERQFSSTPVSGRESPALVWRHGTRSETTRLPQKEEVKQNGKRDSAERRRIGAAYRSEPVARADQFIAYSKSRRNSEPRRKRCPRRGTSSSSLKEVWRVDWRDAAIDQLLTAQLIRAPYFERACQPQNPPGR